MKSEGLMVLVSMELVQIPHQPECEGEDRNVLEFTLDKGRQAKILGGAI